jgi:UDP-glucose 4-epimerase
MKVCILGAAGFIGKALVGRLDSLGFDLRCCDRRGGKVGNVRIETVDLANGDEFSEWMTRGEPDLIIHLAAQLPSSAADKDIDVIANNFTIDRNVYDFVREGDSRLIFASSCAVYGGSEIPWREDALLAPDSPYGISKTMGEMMFRSCPGLNLTVLRISAPFGTDNPRHTVVNIFMERALKGKTLYLYGDGTREQDFVYIEDVCEAFVSAAKKKRPDTYNIASGQSVSMKELASSIVAITKSKSKVEFADKADPENGRVVKIEVGKAKLSLGFDASGSLKRGLDRMREEAGR